MSTMATYCFFVTLSTLLLLLCGKQGPENLPSLLPFLFFFFFLSFNTLSLSVVDAVLCLHSTEPGWAVGTC